MKLYDLSRTLTLTSTRTLTHSTTCTRTHTTHGITQSHALRGISRFVWQLKSGHTYDVLGLVAGRAAGDTAPWPSNTHPAGDGFSRGQASIIRTNRTPKGGF